MKYVIFLITILIVVSCSQDEKFIDNYSSSTKALIFINLPNTSIIKKVDIFKNEILDENILQKIKEIPENEKLNAMKQYRDNIFLISYENKKIYVLDFNSKKYKATIDFSPLKLEPTDITFANATDAYVTHSNSNEISIIDLTNFSIARQIKVGSSPRAIAASGNQIYIANYNDNTISVVDSRTNRQEAIIEVAPKPIFLFTRADGKEIIVISKGNGKDATDVEHTPAVATFINVEKRQKVAEIPIGTSIIKPENVSPIAACLTNSNYLFISTGENLLRINARTRSAATNIGKYRYSFLTFSNYTSEIFAISNDENNNSNKIVVCDRSSGKMKYSINTQQGTIWILPIY